MTLSHKTLIPLAAALGVVATALAVAIPALAGSSWSPQEVECQVDTKTITVKGDVKNTSPTVDDIYYNGRLVYRENVQTDEMGVGPGAYDLKVPYVQLGGQVRVVNEDNGQTIYATCHDAVPLNGGHGEHWAALYNDLDPSGDPAISVFCVLDGVGQWRGQFTKAEFKAIPNRPDENTFVKAIEGCYVPIAAYRLTSGEFQINIGPDGEGKSAVMVFRRVPPIETHFYDIDPGLHWQ